MKLAKFAFVCAAVASLAVVADDVSSEIAILKVDKPADLHTIPVGINFAAADGTAVSVSNAVKTAGLPSDTRMYVFSKDDNQYYIYSISNNAWVPNAKYYINEEGTLSAQETIAANAMQIPAGSAVFLELPSGDQSSVNVITAGKPVTTSETTIQSGANLCCFPVGKAVNLNTDTADVQKLLGTSYTPRATTFKNTRHTVLDEVGDTIVVLSNDSGASRVYYYYDGSWGYIAYESSEATYKSFITEGCSIPGGVGFWYNKASGN